MKANRFNFRVLDKEYNQMVYPDGNGYFQLTNDTVITGDGDLFDLENQEIVENCVLMQSTGLVDKNGKEIFEGDIINITKEFEDLMDEVFYDEELCSIRLKGYSNDYCDFADWIREGFKFEVIGNIYENQELLKKLKD